MFHTIISSYTTTGIPDKENGDQPTSETFTLPTNIFRLPIYYNKQKCIVSEDIMNELELTKVYEVLCPSISSHDKNVLECMASSYTTDVKYLQDTQDLIKKYRFQPSDICIGDITKYETVIELEKELQIDQFLSKYGYVDYEGFHFINNMENIMQVLTMYTLLSPLITMATPLIIMVVPFFILQFKYSTLSWSVYLDVLKDIGKNNPIIRMFTHYYELTPEQKMYQCLTFAFYVFSIYQQINYCVKFYENFKAIHNYLYGLRKYLERTIQNMRHIISFTHDLKSYKAFNTDICKNINETMDIVTLLSPIQEFQFTLNNFLQIGYVLKTFYVIKTKSSIMENVQYALHFNSYIKHIESLVSLRDGGKIYGAKLLKEKTPVVQLKEMYYPALVASETEGEDDEDEPKRTIIKNNVSLSKNLMITGPNASGKTTTIKAIFINVLLTQQFGMGCYSSASITPFKYLHCYLNIPDTMGRDSLFQAEARRCKNIIDNIHENTDGKHLGMFDELFSGTNPDEAVNSSRGFIEYITKYSNVKWVLTTHFNKLCKSLDKHPQIINCHMDVVEKKGEEEHTDFVFTYKLKKNISKVKGASKILSDMKFPKEIIKNSFCLKE